MARYSGVMDLLNPIAAIFRVCALRTSNHVSTARLCRFNEAYGLKKCP